MAIDNQDIEKMRSRLRLSVNNLDDEISGNMSAAIADMLRVGTDVDDTSLSDDLIFTCVEFWCKWIFNFEAEGEKYHIAYEALRDSLSLRGNHNEN